MNSRYKLYVQARELKFLLSLSQDVGNVVSGVQCLDMNRLLNDLLNKIKPELKYISCSAVLPDIYAALLKIRGHSRDRKAGNNDLPEIFLSHVQCAIRRNVRCTKDILEKLEIADRDGVTKRL